MSDRGMYFKLAPDGEGEEASREEWSRFMESADAQDPNPRIVAKATPVPGVEVSTVFLGLSHQYTKGGPPLIWETMIFGGKEDGWTDRATTRAQAVEQHVRGIEVAVNAAKVT